MADLNRAIFSGMQILFEEAWLSDHAVVVEGSVIKGIIPESMIAHHLPAKHYEYPKEYYLIPGLIDLHIHGTHGHDVMDGNVDALHKMSKALAADGVTAYLATTMTADKHHLASVLKTIPQAMQQAEGAAILGVHLEGPFIAASKMGAQRPDAMEAPDITYFHHLQHLAGNAIKIVTLAPELPNALAFIQAVRKSGVMVSIGHTNASFAETNAAIAAGCTQATHLFNAMRSIHHREPGALGALLLAEEVAAELIVDGVHLHPAMVELALRLKGKKKLLLVTDAMRAKCLNNGQYDLGGQEVLVMDGKATLGDGTLAGSTLALPQAIKHMVKFAKCTLLDAISMATQNPAQILGLTSRKGSIEMGKDADLVVMTPGLEVQLTMREGQIIWQ